MVNTICPKCDASNPPYHYNDRQVTTCRTYNKVGTQCSHYRKSTRRLAQ